MSWSSALPGRSFIILLCLALLFVRPVTAGTLVQFRFPTGTVDVELFDQDKPATVQNFLRYLHTGRFQNIFAHRCDPGFVVQGGRYLTPNRFDPALLSADHVFSYQSFAPIVNEFSVGTRRSNTYGTIAMARVPGLTNSATSEWFFNLGDNSFLDGVDGGFTVFGRALRGFEVFEVFNAFGPNNGVIDMRQYSTDAFLTNVFRELPVFYLGARRPRVSELFYVDISTVDVQVRLGQNASRHISWNSVPGVTNIVEFTPTLPPSWATLASTNGNGQRFTVTDGTPVNGSRLYRVRMQY